MIRLRNLRDRLAARLLVALDADCGPVADDDGIEPDPRPWLIRWADDDDQDES